MGINRLDSRVLSCYLRQRVGSYLTKKLGNLFCYPELGGKRIDSQGIRQKILSISYSDWKKLGFSKGTLHYMKQNAESEKPFGSMSIFL
ncbi:hypothetical protein [Methanosarcina sp. UBA5]|uniref:hypothetical protein n=1 Tax=Methanosarcina sp. UBA5 TaxID=1915593 RepID=UPI0025E557F5|nr:hypothetical protein [Methanosarcina sp. UBA5]